MTGISHAADQAQNSLDLEAANTLFSMKVLEDEILLFEEQSVLRPEYDQVESKRKNDERQAAILRAALTQAHRANESLRHGMTALIETSAQPTFVLDRGGFVTVWNHSMQNLTGISGGEAFGQNFEELFIAESLAPLQAAVAEILLAGSFPGGLESSAPRRLPETLSLSPDLPALSFTLLPVCLLTGCLDTLILLVEPSPLV